MKITLTSEKITKITSRITELLEASRSTIRNVAQIVGYLVSSFPAVRYGECHYRAIERDKILALKILRFKVLYWLPGVKHAKFMIDNTTAVSVINNKGTSHNDKCNDVVCDIWALCEKHAIGLQPHIFLANKI
jgi:uncharacterized protein (UPF0297 family)